MDLPCPHCTKGITIDSDKLKVVNQNLEGSATVQEVKPPEPKPEVKEKIVEKVKTIAPSYIPNFKCKDGKCGKVHPNDNYHTKIVGRCENCKQFTPDVTQPCMFCDGKEFEELEEDELKELGIPEPKEVPHEHESL